MKAPTKEEVFKTKEPRSPRKPRLKAKPLAIDFTPPYTPDGEGKSYPLSNKSNRIRSTLDPLLEGKTVKLILTRPGKVRKGNTFVSDKSLVIIVPGLALGEERECFLVSIIGKGSVLVRPFVGSSLANLVLAGMTAKLAMALSQELRRILID